MRWYLPAGDWRESWETRILRGIADESPATASALLDSDVLLGTSAGSTVSAQLGSGIGLDELFARQVAEESFELDPGVSIDTVIELFVTAMMRPNTTTAEKLRRIGAVAYRPRPLPRPSGTR